MNTRATDIEQFRVQLYNKLQEVLYSSSRNMCYTIAQEAQCIVNNYNIQDPELIRIANSIVITFLDELEHKLSGVLCTDTYKSNY